MHELVLVSEAKVQAQQRRRSAKKGVECVKLKMQCPIGVWALREAKAFDLTRSFEARSRLQQQNFNINSISEKLGSHGSSGCLCSFLCPFSSSFATPFPSLYFAVLSICKCSGPPALLSKLVSLIDMKRYDLHPKQLDYTVQVLSALRADVSKL
eukprot:772060-Amphidinium_carterae.1